MYTGLQKSFPNCSMNILKFFIRKYAVDTLKETENVIYPPILDLSYRARMRRKDDVWYNKIKKIETVEEKLIGLNMPHYYGWKSLYLEEGNVPYNSLNHAQYITHTHVLNDNKLPEFYNSLITTEELNSLAQSMKKYIEDIIIFEYCHRLREQYIPDKELHKDKIIQNAVTNAVVFQINRMMLAALSSIETHLLDTEIDFEPRIETFWFAGGIERSTIAKRQRRRIKYLKEYADDPINIPVQYLGSPILQLRHSFPLREVISPIDCANPELTIPKFEFDPRVLGYRFSYRHATCIPGFWPGDAAEFGLLSYHSTNKSYFHSAYKEKEAITVQAIFASYSWLLSQAVYQGFTTVQDVTYPLVTQTVLTNGQYWSFCVYQLNTTLSHSEYADNNPMRNMCWITEPMPLFEKVEDGKVYGFNEDVLKTLITFYINKPEQKNECMTPYLGESVKHIADIADVGRRTWLESTFKHLMSNRPRHVKKPEIYHWQKIYKIDNKTRPIDKKRDPWEFGWSGMKRRLNQHAPPYVPKCLRENPKLKKVGRFAKQYYPDA
ncbi:hypothetical protein K0M31_017030 [Melipona bicolor]|uniref:28S ribosomal protein S30, mitochondrial n=1 Tax=Melipona bicolor TaxID=60889 RepID=A0AA40FDH7_9HYME|nr:hypothetical protein K0M31_017030 [Melipona bicolor]